MSCEEDMTAVCHGYAEGQYQWAGIPEVYCSHDFWDNRAEFRIQLIYFLKDFGQAA